MKKTIGMFIISMVFIGCETPQGERHKKDGYSVVEIDGCQYIEVSNWVGSQSGYYSLTHKGNCKKCLLRNKVTPLRIKEK